MASNWRFWHFGVVVSDIDKAAEHYGTFGIGPFGSGGQFTPLDRRVYGKPAADVKNVARIAPIGPIKVELVQPVTGHSVQREFLDKHGEGVNHIAFLVDDIDKETAKMVEAGYRAVSSGKMAEGGGFAYFDTDKVGGILIELTQLPEGSPE